MFDMAWHQVNAVNDWSVITHNGITVANNVKLQHEAG